MSRKLRMKLTPDFANLLPATSWIAMAASPWRVEDQLGVENNFRKFQAHSKDQPSNRQEAVDEPDTKRA